VSTASRDRAYSYIRERQRAGEVVTGLPYISPDSQDLHAQARTVNRALAELLYETLCPGSKELAKLQDQFR
jgi:2-oxoglutarate ferredoxin oxidoreductase subunit beta